MVIDVDPEFSFRCSVDSIFTKTWFGSAIESDTNLHIERLGWWSLDALAFCHKAKVIREPVFIDVVNSFSHGLKRVAERKLGADCITIWADVAEENKRVVATDSFS